MIGRTFESVRMGAKEVSARWLKAGRALKKEDQVYAQKLAKMIKKHSSEGFYALDDPLEAAPFSILIELMKELDEKNVDLWFILQGPCRALVKRWQSHQRDGGVSST